MISLEQFSPCSFKNGKIMAYKRFSRRRRSRSRRRARRVRSYRISRGGIRL